MAIDLSKVQSAAKKIRKAHPNMSNSTVMKEAWKKAKGGRAVSGVKKGKGKKVGKVAHRKSRKAPKYVAREVHEIRRVGAISYSGGKVKISGVSEVEAKKKALLHALAEQSGWVQAAITQAKTKREKSALMKERNRIVAEMRKVS